jgi:hypothetical protein
MRACHPVLALLAIAPLCAGAEIHPLKGDSFKAELVRVTDKEVVYKLGGKEVSKPIGEVVKIDYREVGKPAAGTSYTRVELTDGTVLQASAWSLKKRDVELTLLAGPVVKVPLDLVANVLREGHVEQHRRDWKTRVFNTRNREALVVKRGGVISNIDCTLGEGTEAGTEISFAVILDGETSTRKRKLATLHGLIFKHALPNKAPATACKLYDTQQDVVMVAALSATPAGLRVTTPAGARLEFRNEQIARLDYSKGRFEYLSELEPVKLVQKCSLDEDPDKPEQWHVYKDTNLNMKPLTVGGTKYARGLAVKPFVELTYDLKGEYRELSVVIGFDDNVGVGADGVVVVVFERDGKELAAETISPDDKKRYKALTLNVKDVQKLKITVKSDGEVDWGRHIDLADAKVSK